jgi:hypothetical protein
MTLVASSSSSIPTYAPLVSPTFTTDRDRDLVIKPKVLDVLIKIPETKTLISDITDYLPINIRNYGSTRVGLTMSIDFSDPTDIKLLTNKNLIYTVCPEEEINFLIWLRSTKPAKSVDLMLSVKLEELLEQDPKDYESTFQFYSTELIINDPFKTHIHPDFSLKDELVKVIYKVTPIEVDPKIKIKSVDNDIVEFLLNGNTHRRQVQLLFDEPPKSLIILSSCASEGTIGETFDMHYYLYNSTSDTINCSIDCLFFTCCGNLGFRPIDIELSPQETKKATLQFFPLKSYPKEFPPPIVEFPKHASIGRLAPLEYEYRHVSGPISFVYR